MSNRFNGRELAQIESVTKPLLERLSRGNIARMGRGQKLVIGDYTLDESWEIRFVPPAHPRASRRDSLSPVRFVATAADNSVTLTVEDRRLQVRKRKVNRPLSMSERGFAPRSVYG